LEEARDMSVEGLTEANLSEEEVEQQLSGETVELKYGEEWPASAIGDEDNIKGQIDQIGKEEKEHTFQCSQEMEEEEHSMEFLKNFSQGDEHEATVELGSTAEGDEHSKEWLKIFNHEAEKEITAELKPAVEEERETDSMDFFDLCEELEALERRVNMQSHLIHAGASLHLSNAPTFQHISAHSREGEAPTLPFLNLKYDPIRINVVRLSENQAIPLYRQKIRSPLMADRLMALDSIQTRWPFKKLQCNR
jgi:hypothetical protein